MLQAMGMTRVRNGKFDHSRPAHNPHNTQNPGSSNRAHDTQKSRYHTCRAKSARNSLADR